MTTWDEFMAELEEEARAEGPAALAEFHALGEHFQRAVEKAALRRLDEEDLRSGRKTVRQLKDENELISKLGAKATVRLDQAKRLA